MRESSNCSARGIVEAQLAPYATACVLGWNVRLKYPILAAHFDMCAACRGELEELIDFILALYSGELDTPEDVPTPDLRFLLPGDV